MMDGATRDETAVAWSERDRLAVNGEGQRSLQAIRDFVDGLDSQRIECVSTEIDDALKEQYPIVRHVFLDATTATPEQREVAREVVELAQADADGDKGAAERLQEMDAELGATTRH